MGDLLVRLAGEAGDTMLDHFEPAPAPLDDDRHAGGHRLEARPRPVLDGVAV